MEGYPSLGLRFMIYGIKADVKVKIEIFAMYVSIFANWRGKAYRTGGLVSDRSLRKNFG